jgi:predicted nucleic acid-binding protein
VLELEIDNNLYYNSSQTALTLYRCINETIYLTDAIKSRAISFEQSNVKAMDSLHLATAESANADILLSTDRDFIKAAKRTDAAIRVENPFVWLSEVMINE